MNTSRSLRGRVPSTAAEAILIRTHHGKVHRATRVGKQVQTSEACNIDDATGWTVLESLAEMGAEALTCDRCFPPETWAHV